MTPSDPAHTFHGLPLTVEQEQEVRHYIRTRQRAGEAWDTAELKAMVADMLVPPEAAEEDVDALAFSMDAERTAAARQHWQDEQQGGAAPADAADQAH